MPLIYQAGRQVITPEATYLLPDEESAHEALERFLAVQRTDDEAVAALRRYNAHLETLLAGALYHEDPKAFADQADLGVYEVPKAKARK